MKRLKLILTLTAILTGTVVGHAQYYTTGQNPASLKWNTIEGDSLKIVFPNGYGLGAERQLMYMQTAKRSIGYGFRQHVMPVSVVLKTENFVSNGISLLAPKRIEIITVPATDTYSEPWMKQLAVHEYRHMVQYSNINRNFVRVAGTLLGQQAVLAATGVLPFWLLEGDATDAETQMSSFGRGLQPSFTMHYRALGDEILQRRNPDKWFCGSFNEFVPNHYNLGYQLVTWANTHFDEFVWDKVADYGSRNAFLLFTTPLALRKYYGLSTTKLFRNTFTDLNAYWDSLPAREDSGTRVPVKVESVYTQYSYPIFVDESTIVCVKEDYDRPPRFVEIDVNTGTEKVLTHTGRVNSRPWLSDDGVLYWTEWRQSTFWEQRVNSQLCSMSLTDHRPHTVRGQRRVLYPLETSDGQTAFVQYDYDGTYSICSGDKSYSFDNFTSLHGLAYDRERDLYYCISLNDSGMGIDEVNLTERTVRNIKPHAHVTLSDLNFSGGRLYFGSIASGYDEIHMLELADGSEQRISSSHYGSFAPSASPDGKSIAYTTYDRRGYLPATGTTEGVEKIAYSSVPQNIVNPERLKWDVINMDTVVFDPNIANNTPLKAKRYRKAAHLLNPHSWAPLYYDPSELMDAEFSSIRFGATLLSQNLLSSMESRLGYGYSFDGHSVVEANFKYLGWAPKIEFNLQWQDRKSGYSSPVKTFQNATENDDMGYYRWFEDGGYKLKLARLPQAPEQRDYMRLYGRIYLPILLNNGYHTSFLTPSVEYNYRNTPVYVPTKQKYIKNNSAVYTSVQFTDYVATARRDMQPRWSTGLKVTFANSLFNHDATSTVSILARVNTPGLLPHHGLTLRANYQTYFGKGAYSTTFKDLFPRGIVHYPITVGYKAFSADYLFPIAYPDWGINGLFFLNRIGASVYGDYARYNSFKQVDLITADSELMKYGSAMHSYGGSLLLNIVPLRMPSASSTTLRLSLYFPSTLSKPVFSAGVSMPL